MGGRPAVRGAHASLLVALATLALLLALVAPLAAPAAERKAKETEPPKLDARAWVLLDARDGSELAAHKAGAELPIASATKLMTAYLALKRLRLDRKLEAPGYDAAPAESVLGLRAGEKLTVRDLLVAMMLPSANDAALTVADGVAGSERRFVARMNRAARRLGLSHTSYANPIGLDDRDNYSSARDLADLALELVSDPRFAKIVAKPSAKLESGAEPRTVETRNTLLQSDPSVTGVKTGHTNSAGYVLVATAERRGIPLVSVVLGAPSEAARDAESERLLDYGFSLYSDRRAVRRDERLGGAPVRYEEQELAIVAGEGMKVEARSDQSLEVELRPLGELEGPIEEGERLSRAVVLLDGRRVGAVPGVAGNAVAAPGIVDRLGLPALALIVVGSILLLVGLVIVARRGWRRMRRETMPRTPEERTRSRGERERRRQEGRRS